MDGLLDMTCRASTRYPGNYGHNQREPATIASAAKITEVRHDIGEGGRVERVRKKTSWVKLRTSLRQGLMTASLSTRLAHSWSIYPQPERLGTDFCSSGTTSPTNPLRHWDYGYATRWVGEPGEGHQYMSGVVT